MLDRLQALDRLIDHLEVRRVLDRDNALRAPLLGAELVEHPVLRHLEEPRSELAAQRETRERLGHPHENLLRQILRERTVADDPVDVVEDRRLVSAQDHLERALVTPLRPAEK